MSLRELEAYFNGDFVRWRTASALSHRVPIFMEKPKQLDIFTVEEEKVNVVYYNGLGEPLPWELEQAIKEGYIPRKEVN